MVESYKTSTIAVRYPRSYFQNFEDQEDGQKIAAFIPKPALKLRGLPYSVTNDDII